VVLAMTRAFPGAPVLTSLFDPAGTFPEFAAIDVRPSVLNRMGLLRRHHRLAIPLLAPMFSSTKADADVVICSSSGWAHGVSTAGRKVVYCYSPARWLYQTDRYLGARGDNRAGSKTIQRLTVGALRRPLERWDAAAARSASRYVAVSTSVARSIRDLYGIEAEVLPPPPALDGSGPQEPVPGLEPGFWLCVSRLLPYKNVDAIARAVAGLAGERLVVIGSGPERARLEALAGPSTTFLSGIADTQLSWCYANCKALVAASYEDYGLTPLEAAAFGRPSVTLRFGGYLDTVVEGSTGVHFDEPTPSAVSAALGELAEASWDATILREQAGVFAENRFAARLREIVADEARTT
jgi:glycosyltransferase involved in cell wall biosynthesis